MLREFYAAVEHMSSTKAAITGGAGATISLATAAVDPGAMAPWLHLATLSIGSMTGLASLVLVILKILQQRRDMRD
jgi:hypothetical protein